MILTMVVVILMMMIMLMMMMIMAQTFVSHAMQYWEILLKLRQFFESDIFLLQHLQIWS